MKQIFKVEKEEGGSRVKYRKDVTKPKGKCIEGAAREEVIS